MGCVRGAWALPKLVSNRGALSLGDDDKAAGLDKYAWGRRSGAVVDGVTVVCVLLKLSGLCVRIVPESAEGVRGNGVDREENDGAMEGARLDCRLWP